MEKTENNIIFDQINAKFEVDGCGDGSVDFYIIAYENGRVLESANINLDQDEIKVLIDYLLKQVAVG